jgi:hypothetical protein
MAEAIYFRQENGCWIIEIGNGNEKLETCGGN